MTSGVDLSRILKDYDRQALRNVFHSFSVYNSRDKTCFWLGGKSKNVTNSEDIPYYNNFDDNFQGNDEVPGILTIIDRPDKEMYFGHNYNRYWWYWVKYDENTNTSLIFDKFIETRNFNEQPYIYGNDMEDMKCMLSETELDWDPWIMAKDCNYLCYPVCDHERIG